MNLLEKYPFLSNYFYCSIIMNNKEYCSLDEIYVKYKEDPFPYKNLETVMLFGTFLKFLQNKELKRKLLDLDKKVLYNIRSNKIRERLLKVKEVLNVL